MKLWPNVRINLLLISPFCARSNLQKLWNEIRYILSLYLVKCLQSKLERIRYALDSIIMLRWKFEKIARRFCIENGIHFCHCTPLKRCSMYLNREYCQVISAAKFMTLGSTLGWCGCFLLFFLCCLIPRSNMRLVYDGTWHIECYRLECILN